LLGKFSGYTGGNVEWEIYGTNLSKHHAKLLKVSWKSHRAGPNNSPTKSGQVAVLQSNESKKYGKQDG